MIQLSLAAKVLVLLAIGCAAAFCLGWLECSRHYLRIAKKWKHGYEQGWNDRGVWNAIDQDPNVQCHKFPTEGEN